MRISNLNEDFTKGMRSDFTELVVRRFKVDGSNLRCISSTVDQRDVVTVEVVKFLKVTADSGSPIPEEPGETLDSDEVVEDDDNDWDPKGIMTAEESQWTARKNEYTAEYLSLQKRRGSGSHVG